MSLIEAIKGLIVVVAVMFGASSNAFAHAGHAHAQNSATSIVASSSLAAVTPHALERFSSAIALPSSVHASAPVNAVQSVQSSPTHTGGAVCPPGACCCQGASSCGMAGHCCSMMPEQATWTNDLSNHMRYHLARLGWVYPDIVIGLDRPPKA